MNWYDNEESEILNEPSKELKTNEVKVEYFYSKMKPCDDLNEASGWDNQYNMELQKRKMNTWNQEFLPH